MNTNDTWTPATTSDKVETSSCYEVRVIRNKCVGDGACVAFAPKVFQLDDEQIAAVISQTGESDAKKLLAAQVCPTSAIVVIDKRTGKQIWPIPEPDEEV